MSSPVEVQNPTAIPQLLNNFFPNLKINHWFNLIYIIIILDSNYNHIKYIISKQN